MYQSVRHVSRIVTAGIYGHFKTCLVTSQPIAASLASMRLSYSCSPSLPRLIITTSSTVDQITFVYSISTRTAEVKFLVPGSGISLPCFPRSTSQNSYS